MEVPSGGILARLGEKFLGWIGLALLVLIGIAIWRMDPVLRTAIWQGVWRTILWIALAAALPWSARFYIRRILGVGSNWAGVGLLAALVLVDLGAGLLLLSGCDTAVEAKRLAVANDEPEATQPSDAALPSAPKTTDVTDAVRERLADVAEGAANVASKTAERLRVDEDREAKEVETAVAGAGTESSAEKAGRGHGGWFWLACLAALALAGTYNYLVTEYLAETAGG